MTNYTPTHDEIAARAYQIYLRDGCVEGRDLDNWLRAEAELRSGGTQGNGSSNGSGATTDAVRATERSSTPAPRRQENILPNSVVPPAAPIAQVSAPSRSTTPRKGSGKREAAAAAK